MTSYIPTSMITQSGRKAEKKDQGPSLEELFRADLENAKQRNERLLAQGQEPENKKFGRWVVGVLKDSAWSPLENRARSRIDLPREDDMNLSAMDM